MKKARGEAKLKILPDVLQEELWQYLRKHTQTATLAWLLEEPRAIKSSAPALTEFFSWYPRSCTLRQAATTSDQLAATLRKLPELKITAANAAKIAQVNFEIQAAQDRDPELFAALRKGELERDRLTLEREKFEESKKEDWEQGLDALQAEIKGNAQALQLFEQLAAVLKKGRAA